MRYAELGFLSPCLERIFLANNLVLNCLDYCNSLLVGIKKSNMLKLQISELFVLVMITKMSKYEHVTHLCDVKDLFQTRAHSL